MDRDQIRSSRFLSLVLRHKPEHARLTLDEAGWCRVDELLKGCAAHGHRMSREDLELIVAENDKKRFEFSENGQSIRARQGHSIQVDLKYEPQTPPDLLYHGTATRYLAPIKQKGLIRGARQHVHLSVLIETAAKVGSRHGKPVVIPVRAREMHDAGFLFYFTANQIWLVDAVPPQYLKLDELVFS